MATFKPKKQTKRIDEVVKASYYPLKDWRADPKGYFLIRINAREKQLEVAFVTYKHVITKVVRGKYASEIYNTIIRRQWITKLEHAAYLGKELYKAETALRYGGRYVQDAALVLSLGMKVKGKES